MRHHGEAVGGELCGDGVAGMFDGAGALLLFFAGGVCV